MLYGTDRATALHAPARRAVHGPLARMSAADARHLLESGRGAEAEAACLKLLESAPQDVEVINVLALAVLRRGDAARARELLQLAAHTAPEDAATQHHLGRAYEALADYARAAEAHAAALRLDPALYIARLHRAAALERLRDLDGALVHYKRALDDAQRAGVWLNPETTPPLLRPLVQHAVVTVRQGRRRLFEALFAPLRGRYGAQSLDRVERCIRIYLKDEPPVYPDPRQRPTFLLFPGLPTAPYFNRAHLPWIDTLEAATPAVLGELEQLLPSSSGRERVFGTDALEAQNLRGTLDEPPSWDGYYFYRWGVRRDDNCRSCPRTAAVLDALPLCRIRQHGPEVLFSVFTSGTHLLPHRGVTNTRVVGHLPLIVPEQCALNVGGEIHEWRTGRVVVFDDTYEHEAWNRSKSTRVVLIFDTWNPYLTEVERAAITDLVTAIGDFRSAAEQA